MKIKTVITAEQLTTLRHELARLLSEVTGAAWSHKPDPDHTWHNTMIVGQNGAVITVERASEDGKVIIGGWSKNYGETPSYHETPMPTIRVAYQRGPETIFKEITRRFLPEFLKALAAADKYIAERDLHRDTTRKTFDALYSTFSLCRAVPRNQRNDEGGGMIYAGKTDTGNIEVRVNSANSVEFSVKYLNRERAIKLAGFLSAL
jgi:hypothetical protein